MLPHLNGKITGMSFRVPTADVSVVDLTFKIAKEATYAEVMAMLKLKSETTMKGVLGYTSDAVVSTDFVHDPNSSIVDAAAGASPAAACSCDLMLRSHPPTAHASETPTAPTLVRVRSAPHLSPAV